MFCGSAAEDSFMGACFAVLDLNRTCSLQGSVYSLGTVWFGILLGVQIETYLCEKKSSQLEEQGLDEPFLCPNCCAVESALHGVASCSGTTCCVTLCCCCTARRAPESSASLQGFKLICGLGCLVGLGKHMIEDSRQQQLEAKLLAQGNQGGDIG